MHLLIITNDGDCRKRLPKALKDHGCRATVILEGSGLAAAIAIHTPDVLVLDMNTAAEHAHIETCKRLRTWTAIPIIVTSADGREATTVQVLDAGADDYVLKPFGVGELLARCRSIRRRLRIRAGSSTPLVQIGDLTVDLVVGKAFLQGRPLPLTHTEYRVLHRLIVSGERTVTYGELLKDVWQREDNGVYLCVRTAITRLRRKLGEDCRRPRFILTEGAAGYRLNRC
ncbi:MAG: response regulator transcription factor [Anaerolineae bacterium]|nr:response regulator transcription factor [Anaerolineae bacterium]